MKFSRDFIIAATAILGWAFVPGCGNDEEDFTKAKDALKAAKEDDAEKLCKACLDAADKFEKAEDKTAKTKECKDEANKIEDSKINVKLVAAKCADAPKKQGATDGTKEKIAAATTVDLLTEACKGIKNTESKPDCREAVEKNTKKADCVLNENCLKACITNLADTQVPKFDQAAFDRFYADLTAKTTETELVQACKDCLEEAAKQGSQPTHKEKCEKAKLTNGVTDPVLQAVKNAKCTQATVAPVQSAVNVTDEVAAITAAANAAAVQSKCTACFQKAAEEGEESKKTLLQAQCRKAPFNATGPAITLTGDIIKEGCSGSGDPNIEALMTVLPADDHTKWEQACTGITEQPVKDLAKVILTQRLAAKTSTSTNAYQPLVTCVGILSGAGHCAACAALKV